MTTRHYACLPRAAVSDGRHSIMTIQDAHIELIRQWRNAQMDVLRQKEPLTEEGQTSYYSRCIWPTLVERHPANILLAFLEDERLVGYGGLVHISWPDQRAEVSFLLKPALASNAADYEARFSAFLSLLKQLAFGDLGIERLWTETFASRGHHIAVLEANGFRPEGCLRGHVRIAGARLDSLLHGCLANEG